MAESERDRKDVWVIHAKTRGMRERERTRSRATYQPRRPQPRQAHELRDALIEGEYKGKYFKEDETGRFARATDPNLNDDTPWERVMECQIGARKAKYDNPGIAASFFYYLCKRWASRRSGTPREQRAVLVTRNLQAIEGTQQEPSSYRRPGDKRPASPTRESPSTQYREREREKAPRRKVRD